jgi:hypothetical protein
VRALAGRWAPWLAVAVLVAGVVAVTVARHNGSDSSTPPHRGAPLTAAERRLANEFLDTAVARKHLDRAWELVAPQLKEGISLETWKTGSIPVVPYPVAQAKVALHTVNSFTDRARLNVNFVPARAQGDPATFTLDLQNLDGRWLRQRLAAVFDRHPAERQIDFGA